MANYNKRARIILLLIYLSILLGEIIFISSNHNNLGLMAIGFYEAFLIYLIMDIPIFVFIAILVNFIKETIAFRKHKSSKNGLTLILSSFVTIIVSALLFVFTSNSVNPTINIILFYSTIISASVAIILFFIYLVKTRKHK
ncbi:MAG: hypothetical protein E7582_04075 [Ruminococcaceae bacterium]|nr:hypothetical protein [Oscillospiraceae bacterium]